MAPRDVWFVLKDRQGDVVASDSVELADSAKVAHLRHALHGGVCPDVPPHILRVYKVENEVSTLLDPAAALGNNGRENFPLVVVIPEVWFKLVDESGNPFQGTDEDSVYLNEESNIKKLRELVKDRYRYSLPTGITASHLQVYTDEEAYSSTPKKGLLQAGNKIDSYGKAVKSALIVVVPHLKKRPAYGEGFSMEEDVSLAKRGKPDDAVWIWPKEEEPKYSIAKSTMFFVNRDRATEQLYECHKRKFYRGEIGGLDWSIPLVDHVFGLGKSTFGHEYIRRCKQKWKKMDDAMKREGDFEDVIRSCHTIRVMMSNLDIQGEDGAFDSMKADRSLVRHICRFFDKCGNRPRSLAPEALSDSSSILFDDLTMEVGPLFIVLDEIGIPFKFAGDVGNNDADMARRERFMQFCESVLLPLMPVEKMFFLIAGRASFLNFVGLRPQHCDLISSPFQFQRLSLHLLRATAIEDIIKNTYWDKLNMETIKEHFDLNDDQVTKVAQHLFETTFGHPRSLLSAFQTCVSRDALMHHDARDEPEPQVDWKDFVRRVQYYIKPLQEILSCAMNRDPMDLTALFSDSGRKTITYDSIANSFGIAWEGVVNNATVFMPPYVMTTILASVYLVKDLLTKVASSIRQIPLDYPDIFEILFLARFRELFDKEILPMEKLPSFFNGEQEFGRCGKVLFAKTTYWMPKITSSGSKQPTLNSFTAHPDALDAVMNDIEKILAKEMRLNLKPLSKSASPDILLLTMVGTTKLALGLAVKNYSSAKVTKKTVEDECTKFNRMFQSETDRLNVLIVCATLYNSELGKEFKRDPGLVSKAVVYPCDKFANINEIILLNLSTPENRAEFFGIQGNRVLTKGLENIIQKLPVTSIIAAE